MAFLPRRGGSALARALGITIVYGAALAWPRTTVAHDACCMQCVNPHGGTIPPAGSAPACDADLLPTTSAGGAGVNPDGFYVVGTNDGAGGACLTGTSDVQLFSCTGWHLVNGQPVCHGDLDEFCAPGDETPCIFENGTFLKYTEANGAKEPTVDFMASNNGWGNPSGGAVEYRLKASGDLVVCAVDNPSSCVICPVPPPRK